MSSNSTTTDDVLFIWGQSICRMTLSHGVGWLFYGIYLATFFSYIFRPYHARQFTTNRTLQAAMLALFLSSTLQFVTDFIFSIAQVQGYLMSTRFPLPERKDAWQNTHLPFYVLQRWPAAINVRVCLLAPTLLGFIKVHSHGFPCTQFIISDLIVLWRACSLRQSHRWLKGAMWGLGLADVVVWCVAAAVTSRDATRRSTDHSTDQTINTVSVVTSLIINVIGTVAIGVVAWKHNRTMAQAAIPRWRGDVPRILLVLVETGFIWAFVQLVYLILQYVNKVPATRLDMATGAILKMALYLAAILPTVTLIIVRSRRSVQDSLQPSEILSVCQQCSSVVSTSGTRMRTRGEAVRLTMLPGSPRNDQSKSLSGREPTSPITIMMEEETEVSSKI
ncbi:hypothetical protein MSAN_00867600 [Mycena sanguinolenta]|uniref:Uncharacterized protein n=1 Tax=Mycena sanguinolenta TaxID=230812 RepID=A0A8H6YX27_9AGAR|nr:hypothetical protein MSAN_00867600 [Mycena sanguinolenta]